MPHWITAILLTSWVTLAAGQPWVSAATGEAIEDSEPSSEHSRLVRVGPDHGILVTPAGLTAVRSDVLPKQPALRAAMQAAEARKNPMATRAPCPSGAIPHLPGACSSWCGQVLPKSAARTVGSCSERPQCFCEADGHVAASCRMNCEDEESHPKAATSAPSTAPKVASAPTPNEASKKAGSIPLKPRRLLYDTRVMVDFMLQVEVLFVALELVRRLNVLVKQKCSTAEGDGCRPWSLVLPPWCFVPMWYTEPSNKTRWSSLFDMQKLAGEVAVEELDEIPRVDLGVIPVATSSRPPKLKDGLGDFQGFTKDMQACEAGGQQVEAGRTRGTVVYAGYCGDISVNSLKCGVLNFGFQALVDLVESAAKRSNSILLKNLDALQLHRGRNRFKVGVEGGAGRSFNMPALSPSHVVETAALHFAQSPIALGSLPYLAVRLDTHDVAQKDTAPSAAAAAARINRILKKKKLEQVYVAGALREGFQSELRFRVKEALYFSKDEGGDRLDHRGVEELVELLLCSKAEYFIGSSSSSVFSAAVRRQRLQNGLSSKSSDEVFCPSLQVADAPKRCTAS